jgi:hypothetical protein
MSNQPKTAKDYVSIWADLLGRAQKDPALKKRLIASALDELKAEGWEVETEADGKAVEQAVRTAVENPNMVDVLKHLASGSHGAKTSTDPDYIKAEAKIHGLVLTLSPQACSDLATGMGIGAGISSALSFIPAVGPPLAFVVGVGIATSAGIIALANRGKGVWVTYLWIPPFPSWVHPVS